MTNRRTLITGPMASGKTTLANALADRQRRDNWRTVVHDDATPESARAALEKASDKFNLIVVAEARDPKDFPLDQFTHSIRITIGSPECELLNAAATLLRHIEECRGCPLCTFDTTAQQLPIVATFLRDVIKTASSSQ